MKLFSISKLAIVLLCLGGALVAAPQSRAQSEIAPDHFDGTDSWATAAAANAPTSKAKQHASVATLQDRKNKPTPAPQLVAARTVSTLRSDSTANKKRKPRTPTASN